MGARLIVVAFAVGTPRPGAAVDWSLDHSHRFFGSTSPQVFGLQPTAGPVAATSTGSFQLTAYQF